MAFDRMKQNSVRNSDICANTCLGKVGHLDEKSDTELPLAVRNI